MPVKLTHRKINKFIFLTDHRPISLTEKHFAYKNPYTSYCTCADDTKRVSYCARISRPKKLARAPYALYKFYRDAAINSALAFADVRFTFGLISLYIKFSARGLSESAQ